MLKSMQGYRTTDDNNNIKKNGWLCKAEYMDHLNLLCADKLFYFPFIVVKKFLRPPRNPTNRQ
jgi:hypothetical protein